MRPSARVLGAALATVVLLGVPASPAPARLAADDVSVFVCLSTAAGGCQIGAVKTDPTFKIGVEIGTSQACRRP